MSEVVAMLITRSVVALQDKMYTYKQFDVNTMCLDVAHTILQITEIRVKLLRAASCYRLHNMCCDDVLYCVCIGCSAVGM